MIGLEGYGSDSDDDDVHVNIIHKAVHSDNVPSVTGINKQSIKETKIRKLDISFLPKIMQDALTKGDVPSDDDDDDDDIDLYKTSQAVKRQPISTDASDSSSSSITNRSVLLDMLPKPKTEYQNLRLQLKPSILSSSDSNSASQELDTIQQNVTNERDRKRLEGVNLASTSKNILSNNQNGSHAEVSLHPVSIDVDSKTNERIAIIDQKTEGEDDDDDGPDSSGNLFDLSYSRSKTVVESVNADVENDFSKEFTVEKGDYLSDRQELLHHLPNDYESTYTTHHPSRIENDNESENYQSMVYSSHSNPPNMQYQPKYNIPQQPTTATQFNSYQDYTLGKCERIIQVMKMMSLFVCRR